MLNCDIMLFSGTSLVSEAIKKATDSIYSHVGLIVKFKTTDGTNVDMVIEAVNPFVAMIPLANILFNYKDTGKPYPGQLYVASLKDGLSAGQSKRISYASIEHIGRKYDNMSIVRQALNDLLHLSLSDNDNHRVICSELVYKAYAQGGILLNKENDFATPGSIARDDRFTIYKI